MTSAASTFRSARWPRLAAVKTSVQWTWPLGIPKWYAIQGCQSNGFARGSGADLWAKNPKGGYGISRNPLFLLVVGAGFEPVPSNYSPIGSRRSPEVFVMEPTHAGHLHH